MWLYEPPHHHTEFAATASRARALREGRFVSKSPSVGVVPVGASDLVLPIGSSASAASMLLDVARRNEAAFGEEFLGLVLSGSAGRGLATDRSDLDVHVVLAESVRTMPEVARSPELDEIPVRLDRLEAVPPFGNPDWWFRWSYAWAPVVLDRSGGRVAAAARRQATLTPEEADAVLLEHSRLDGWLNLAYRALKSDRAGRLLECRLDVAESVHWLLDVVFALEARVRPYNSYLAWELRTHPLRRWPRDDLIPLIGRLLDGDPAAVREAFAALEWAVSAHDEARGHRRGREVVAGWDEERTLFL